jgi:hypothetical protein
MNKSFFSMPPLHYCCMLILLAVQNIASAQGNSCSDRLLYASGQAASFHDVTAQFTTAELQDSFQRFNACLMQSSGGECYMFYRNGEIMDYPLAALRGTNNSNDVNTSVFRCHAKNGFQGTTVQEKNEPTKKMTEQEEVDRLIAEGISSGNLTPTRSSSTSTMDSIMQLQQNLAKTQSNNTQPTTRTTKGTNCREVATGKAIGWSCQ